MPKTKPDDDDQVMIFRRPQESPVIIAEGENVRIAYGNSWIDFRNGKILISAEKA